MKAVIPKSAAELDGRIQKGKKSFSDVTGTRTPLALFLCWKAVLCLGDRVVAVNGQSLEGATHQQAVEILRDTGEVKNHVHIITGLVPCDQSPP